MRDWGGEGSWITVRVSIREGLGDLRTGRRNVKFEERERGVGVWEEREG